MKNPSSVLAVARNAAKAAGDSIVAARRDSFVLSYKCGGDLVTSADVEAEAIVVKIIKEAFPQHVILAEESSTELAELTHRLGPLWIIDPIDGTTNFARGHDHCAVSIAFAERGEVQCGVVYAPFVDEEFVGVRGGGATRNGSPLASRANEPTPRELQDILVGFGSSAHPRRASIASRMHRELASVLTACRDIRRLGAASLDVCWVACGRLDAFREELLHPWDIAAARCIATEAGLCWGSIREPSGPYAGTEFFADDIFVAAPSIEQELRALLTQVE